MSVLKLGLDIRDICCDPVVVSTKLEFAGMLDGDTTDYGSVVSMVLMACAICH